MTQIKELQNSIHANAIRKGFWEEPVNIGEKLMLIVSEISEALEAHRKGRHCNPVDVAWFLSTTDESHAIHEVFPEKIKDTFEDEIADAVIRLLDMCAKMDIPIEAHIEAKMRYNATRPYKHGKAY